MRPVIPRLQAQRDIDDAVEYCVGQGTTQAALGFIDALEQALGHIGRYPASGSPRYAHELDLPGLRCWPLTAYPYMLFYVEQSNHVDLWRVLHGQRDIPASMRDPDEG